MISIVEPLEKHYVREAHFCERIENEEYRVPVCTIVEEEAALLNGLLSRTLSMIPYNGYLKNSLANPWGLS